METSSPRSILNTIWQSPMVKHPKKHWSSRSHPRVPSIRIRQIIAKKAGFAGVRAFGNTYKKVDDLIAHVKTLDFGVCRIKLDGQIFEA